MTTTKRKSKRASTKRRKTGLDAGIESMNKTLQSTANMAGKVAVAGMTIGLASSVISMI